VLDDCECAGGGVLLCFVFCVKHAKVGDFQMQGAETWKHFENNMHPAVALINSQMCVVHNELCRDNTLLAMGLG